MINETFTIDHGCQVGDWAGCDESSVKDITKLTLASLCVWATSWISMAPPNNPVAYDRNGSAALRAHESKRSTKPSCFQYMTEKFKHLKWTFWYTKKILVAKYTSYTSCINHIAFCIVQERQLSQHEHVTGPKLKLL